MLPCAGGLFKPVWGMPHTGFFGELDGRHAAMSGAGRFAKVPLLPVLSTEHTRDRTDR